MILCSYCSITDAAQVQCGRRATGDNGCKISCTLLGQVFARYLMGTEHEIARYLSSTCQVPARYLTDLGQARWMLCNCQADWSAGKADQELAGWKQNLNLSFDRWFPSKGSKTELQPLLSTNDNSGASQSS